MLLGKITAKVPTAIVPVPEYGKDTEVMVRALTAGEVEEFNMFGLSMEAGKDGKYQARINSALVQEKKHHFLARCMINQDMKPIATKAELQSAHNPLDENGKGPLDRCWDMVLKLSGLERNTEDEAEDLKKIRCVG